MHLIPRPAGVVSDADSDSNSKPTSKSAAPRKAVQAEGPQASFEIHVALAHDGRAEYVVPATPRHPPHLLTLVSRVKRHPMTLTGRTLSPKL